MKTMTFHFVAHKALTGLAAVSISAVGVYETGSAAKAQNFGIYGACDSGHVAVNAGEAGMGHKGPVAAGGGFSAGGRDCRDARNWQSGENSLDRSHATQTQLIGLGGNLITGLIMNAQARQQAQAQQTVVSEAQTAVQNQQQEIEALKRQLQLASSPVQPTVIHVTLDSRDIQRSVNLAREFAVKINGGLAKYRPASCMFGGAAVNPCLVQADQYGYVFKFSGGRPGWEQEGALPNVLSIVRIGLDGRTVSQLIYNGPVATGVVPR